MSVKNIVIKIVLFFLAIAVLIGAIVLLMDNEEETVKEEITVLTMDENAVKNVDIFGIERISFLQIDGQWKIEGMEGLKVNNAYVSALIKSMANISAPTLVERNSERLSEFGFDNPTVSVTLSGEGFSETVRIGTQSGENFYINVLSNNDVFLMPKSELYMAFLTKMDYFDLTAVKMDGEKITKISIGDITVEKKDDWYEIAPYSRLADGKVMENVLSLLSEIQGDEIILWKDIAFEAEKYDVTEVLIEGDEKQRFFIGPYSDEHSYLHHDGSGYAYKVKNEAVSFIEMSAYDLILKTVAPISITNVTKIEFVSSGRATVLTIDAPSSEAPIFFKNGEYAEEKSFRAFYQKLMSLTFTGECKKVNPAEFAIRFTEEQGKVTDIRFLKFSESEYAVSINGKTEFKVNKKAVTDIFDALKEIEIM